MTYKSGLTLIVILVSLGSVPTVFAQNARGHCPPGLAKKNPPCVPPGQVGKSYQIGDFYEGGGTWSEGDFRRHGLPELPDGESYYRIGDSFIRVDDETRLVLGLIDVLTGLAD